MADAVWHGLEKPMVLPWSSASPAYDAKKNGSYAFDLVRARSLLAQAGVTNGKLDIIWAAGPQELATLALIYQSDLAEIGFDVTLRPLEGAGLLQATNNFDQGVRLGSYSLGKLQPASSTQGAVYGPQTNLSGFKDDAYTQLVNRVVTETDPAKLAPAL